MPLTVRELNKFLDTLPGEPDEWTILAEDGYLLRLFRRDPSDPDSMGWTRAWVNTLTGARNVSDAPPTASVGLVYDDRLRSINQVEV